MAVGCGLRRDGIGGFGLRRDRTERFGLRVGRLFKGWFQVMTDDAGDLALVGRWNDVSGGVTPLV